MKECRNEERKEWRKEGRIGRKEAEKKEIDLLSPIYRNHKSGFRTSRSNES
jgi:hypothetical protein